MQPKLEEAMKNIKGLLYAMVSSGTFGLIGLFSTPLKTEGLDEYSILFYRFFFSAIIIGTICAIRKESIKIPKELRIKLLTLGILYASSAFFFLYSFNYLPTGVSTTMHFMYPIVVSMMMAIFFKEKKSMVIFLATMLSIFGVVMLCWTDGVVIRPMGVLIVVTSVFSYSFYIISVNKSKAGRLNAEVLTFYVMTIGAVIFMIIALVTPKGLQMITSVPAFTRLLLLALLCTVLSGFTLILAIKMIGSTITSILGSMEPLVALIVGVFYFGEKFDLFSLIGISTIFTAVILVIIKSSKRIDAKAVPPQDKIL